jgi:hypothetical protein
MPKVTSTPTKKTPSSSSKQPTKSPKKPPVKSHAITQFFRKTTKPKPEDAIDFDKDIEGVNVLFKTDMYDSEIYPTSSSTSSSSTNTSTSKETPVKSKSSTTSLNTSTSEAVNKSLNDSTSSKQSSTSKKRKRTEEVDHTPKKPAKLLATGTTKAVLATPTTTSGTSDNTPEEIVTPVRTSTTTTSNTISPTIIDEEIVTPVRATSTSGDMDHDDLLPIRATTPTTSKSEDPVSLSVQTPSTTTTASDMEFDDLIDADYLGRKAQAAVSTKKTKKSSKQVESDINAEETADFYSTLEKLVTYATGRKKVLAEREVRAEDILKEQQRQNIRSTEEVFRDHVDDDEDMKLIKSTYRQAGGTDNFEDFHKELKHEWLNYVEPDVANYYGLFTDFSKHEVHVTKLDQQLESLDEFLVMWGYTIEQNLLPEKIFRWLQYTGNDISQFMVQLVSKSTAGKFTEDYAQVSSALSDIGIDIAVNAFKSHVQSFGTSNMDTTSDESIPSESVSPKSVRVVNLYLDFLIHIFKTAIENDISSISDNHIAEAFILSLRGVIEDYGRCSLSKDNSMSTYTLAWELYRTVIQAVSAKSATERDKLIFYLFDTFKQIYFADERFEPGWKPSVFVSISLAKFLLHITRNETGRVGIGLARLLAFEILRIILLSDNQGKEFTAYPSTTLLYSVDPDDDTFAEEYAKLGDYTEQMLIAFTKSLRGTVDNVLSVGSVVDAEQRLQLNRRNREELEFLWYILSLMEMLIYLLPLNDPAIVSKKTVSPSPTVVVDHLRRARDTVKRIASKSMPGLTIQSAIVELMSVVSLNDVEPIKKDPKPLKQKTLFESLSSKSEPEENKLNLEDNDINLDE